MFHSVGLNNCWLLTGLGSLYGRCWLVTRWLISVQNKQHLDWITYSMESLIWVQAECQPACSCGCIEIELQMQQLQKEFKSDMPGPRRHRRWDWGAEVEVPKASRGRGMGRGVPLLIRLGGLGSVVSSPSRVPCPGQKRFLVHFEAKKPCKASF